MPEIDRQPAPRRLVLRDMRQRAGLSQGQLAARLGITDHAIQAWEKGERPVRKPWLFKLADALGCRISDLYRTQSIAHRKRWRRAWINMTDTE